MTDQYNGTIGVVTAQMVDHAGIAVITMAGEVDMLTEQVPRTTAVEALEQSPAGLILDLRAVTFFGSAGINLLVTLQKQAHLQGVPFAVVAAHKTVLKPLEMSGTNVYFTLFPSLSDALTAVRAEPSVPSQKRR